MCSHGKKHEALVLLDIRGVVYLDVKIIGSQDELKESSLINLYKECALEVDS